MSFTVYKLDFRGEEQLRYSGKLLERGDHHVCIQAYFTGIDRNLGYVRLNQGDLFTEWFYDNRWYNVFQVNDSASGVLKGYYCNLTRPAIIGDDFVKADDLALDLFVRPDASTLLLDEEEYAALPLGEDERAHVAQAVKHLKALVAARQTPFDAL